MIFIRQTMEFNDRIVTSLTIFARNCDVRKIDRKTAAEFLDRHHIYGSASCRYCYGLYQRRTTGSAETKLTASGEPALVAVATFSNARRWTKGDKVISSYEWVRYASLEDSRVVGGMGKLLKAFIQDRHPDDIMTYVPLRHFSGEVYESLGFVCEGVKIFPNGERSRKYRLKLKAYR